ncbi:MAG: hypothetical protein BWY25_03289 [Chloroflexi bacterium ADurb.Bin222]|nr:MAG: hypothetical protein BWY25_03289 [Chloroflexi bacterium ADurb.Bin222]
MDGNRIVDERADPLLTQKGAQGFPLGRADDVEMVDVAAVWRIKGQLQPGIAQQSSIVLRERAATRVPRLQVAQFDPQNRRLKLIQTAVEALDVTDVAFGPAVFPQQVHSLCEFWIVGDDGAPIAIRPEVFGGIEAERAEIAPAAYTPSLVPGAMRLSAVFDDPQPMPSGYVQDWRQLGGAAIEVDRDHGARPGGDGGF